MSELTDARSNLELLQSTLLDVVQSNQQQLQRQAPMPSLLLQEKLKGCFICGGNIYVDGCRHQEVQYDKQDMFCSSYHSKQNGSSDTLIGIIENTLLLRMMNPHQVSTPANYQAMYQHVSQTEITGLHTHI